MVKLKNDKTMLKIFSFILNSVSKKNSIMQRFYSLKFEKISLFSNKFFSFIFGSKMTVHTAENEQIFLAQN